MGLVTPAFRYRSADRLEPYEWISLPDFPEPEEITRVKTGDRNVLVRTRFNAHLLDRDDLIRVVLAPA